MHRSATRRAVAIIAAAGASAAGGSAARADVYPNPGGPLVQTSSTYNTAVYNEVAVSQEAYLDQTTIVALLDGTTVYSRTDATAFSDPESQQNVLDADAYLASLGASFGSPVLTGSSITLTGSSTAPAVIPNYTCEEIPGHGTATGNSTVLVSYTFGPADLGLGACRASSFHVNDGQLDINTELTTEYAIDVDVVTTNTYTRAATYTILGTRAGAGAVPEPSSWALLLTGFALAGRRLRTTRRGGFAQAV